MTESSPAAPLLRQPREGTPTVVDTAARLHATIAALAAGTGPVAVDVERASSFRYSNRAYLIQLRRRTCGTHLIDPLAFPDGLSELAAIVGEPEWVVHAATQDLPSLVGEGLIPTRLFDTELAGRLLGYPRVNLGIMVAEFVGFSLEKGYSAADWSTRPLPEPWLDYAALDVELLVELREAIAEQLAQAGKTDWLAQECAWLVAQAQRPAENRGDPWRRTSGIHQVRNARGLAVIRQLWQSRDAIARATDTAPGRILPDAVIIEAARQLPGSVRAFSLLPSLHLSRSGTRRSNRKPLRYLDEWVNAINLARGLPRDQLPPLSTPHIGPPPPRLWAHRYPAAAARLGACRAVLTQVSQQWKVPVENLLHPETVRALTWEPPPTLTEDTVAHALRTRDARDWQVQLCAAALTQALATS